MTEPDRSDAETPVGARAAAPQGLPESEARLRTLAAASFEGIVFSENGRILDVNGRYAEMVGCEPADLVGTDIGALVAPEDRARVVGNIEADRESIVEHAMVTLDGRRMIVEAHGRPFEYEGRRVRVTAVRDITARRREQEQLRRLNRSLQALRRSAQALLRITGEAAYLQEVCRIIVDDCGHRMVWIGLADDDEARSVRPVAYAGFEHGYLEMLRLTWADTERGQGPTGTAIRGNHPCICRDMLVDPRFLPWRDQAVRRGYASSIALPLCAGGRVLGALTIYCTEPDPFSAEEIALLTDLANDLAYGIHVVRLQAAHARAEAALRESEERFRTVLEHSLDAVYRRDLRCDRYDYMSSVIESITGYTSDEMMPMTTAEALALIHPDDRAEVAAEIARAERTGRLMLEYRFACRDGAYRWLADYATVQVDEAGHPIYRGGIVRDITERRRIEEALREADRRKDDFLATLSHELRTPLHAIVGWSQMLLGGSLDERSTRKAIEAIARNALAQNQIVSDVLDVSRIVTGKITLEVREVDPGEAMQQAIESVRHALEARRIDLRLDAAPGLSVTADPARLQQIFWNLLSNAAKFTPPEGTVTVVLDRDDGDVRVRVTDTGVGISPEFLPRVFDRFSQADASASRQHPGLGLGLAIVRHLVELHGGTVGAESAGDGRGATFTVRFPVRAITLRPPTGQAPDEAAGGVPGAALQVDVEGAGLVEGLRVLVVDDDADARELVRTVLASRGALVRTAGSASDAIEVLTAEPFDVLVADIAMPGEDGYALIRRARAITSVPAIALTAYGREQDRLRALAAGYQRHVTKPVLPDVLVAAVASLARASLARL